MIVIVVQHCMLFRMFRTVKIIKSLLKVVSESKLKNYLKTPHRVHYKLTLKDSKIFKICDCAFSETFQIDILIFFPKDLNNIKNTKVIFF